MKNKLLILKHYLICALWTSELDFKELSEVSLPSLCQAKKDIDLFVKKAGSLLYGLTEEQIGHDLWLTRNGHGAGFWDRNLGEIGNKLTKICEEFKALNVFVENDDEIIIE
jgi:hypothetical protein